MPTLPSQMAYHKVDIMATLICSENIANNIFQIILLNINVSILIKFNLSTFFRDQLFTSQYLMLYAVPFSGNLVSMCPLAPHLLHLCLLVPVSSIFCWHHDNVMIWKCSPHYWPSMRGIHHWVVVSITNTQLALLLSLMLAWTSCWTNSQVAGDLRCHDAHVITWKWCQYYWPSSEGNLPVTGVVPSQRISNAGLCWWPV